MCIRKNLVSSRFTIETEAEFFDKLDEMMITQCVNTLLKFQKIEDKMYRGKEIQRILINELGDNLFDLKAFIKNYQENKNDDRNQLDESEKDEESKSKQIKEPLTEQEKKSHSRKRKERCNSFSEESKGREIQLKQQEDEEEKISRNRSIVVQNRQSFQNSISLK
jgi:phage-related minor tail protein